MREVTAVEITTVAFAPYGDLLAAPAVPPRQDWAAPVENHRVGVAANLAVIRSEPFTDMMPLRRLERHPHSSQAFFPLSVGPYLVVVAPDRGGVPAEADIRAFRVPAGVGISYRAGAWHAHMMTVDAAGTFAMLVHEDGTPQDCEFAAIAPVVVTPGRTPE